MDMEEILSNLLNGCEYGVTYKNAKTSLTLLKTGDSYTLHGFYDKSDEDITKLVDAFVLDKAKGEVVHFNEDENYCSIFLNDKSEVKSILNDATQICREC